MQFGSSVPRALATAAVFTLGDLWLICSELHPGEEALLLPAVHAASQLPALGMQVHSICMGGCGVLLVLALAFSGQRD